MAKQNYEECLNRLLKDEGGYSNHPDDKGGPTNYGITIADYRKYVKPDATALDVKNMKLSEAKAIYRKRYWDAIDADNLPSGIDYLWFDYGVNSGVGRVRSIKKKFDLIENPVDYINAVCDERLAFMRSIRGGKDWKVFGKGWSNRVAGVRKRSIQLVNKPVTETKPTTPTVRKAQWFAGITAFFGAAYQWGAEHWQYFIAAGAIGLVSYLAYSIYKFHLARTASIEVSVADKKERTSA